jgi:quinol monooxygenase YgiN
MYTIYVKFTCLPQKREAFIEKVKESGVLSAIRAEDGCIQYDYYYSEKDPDEILLIEAWESRRHQEIHITQPHMDTLRSIKSECITDTKLGEFVLK